MNDQAARSLHHLRDSTMIFAHANSRFLAGADCAWENAGAGVRRQVLGHDDMLMMVRVQFEKDAIGSVHAHPHRQVTYIESGSFEVLIGEDKKVLRGGDCYFIPPGMLHGVVAREQSSLVDVFTPARQDFLAPSSTH